MPGREEYLDSEKYEICIRDYNAPGNIVSEITALNRIRRAQSGLHSHLGIRRSTTPFNDQVMVYGNACMPGQNDMILVAVSLDPHHAQEADFEVPLWEWKLPDNGALAVEDLMRAPVHLDRQVAAVRLDPDRPSVRHLARRAARKETAMNAPGKDNSCVRRRRQPLDPLPYWYKDAIIYQLHVKSFFDSNNDGIGDFPGLIAKLDYIADLGVNAIWLLPFYPSPRLDDGYDIADYRDVHPDYGTMDDCQALHRARRMRAAFASSPSWSSTTPPTSIPGSSARGRPSRARRRATSMSGPTPTRNTPERASSSSTPSARTGPGTRSPRPITGTASIRISPISTSTIRRCSRRCSSVMRFWLDLGVDGLRLDAVPYLVEREGTNNENLPETHAS